ncbi:uncharacterized protein LOC120333880 [Styela clava]
MNSAGQRLCRNKQDLKEFTASEFSFFEDEIRYLAGESKVNDNKNTIIPGGAHALHEELMSIVHDYDWENSSIISPVKLKRKNGSFSRRSDKQNAKRKISNSIAKFQLEGTKNLSQNIVVLLAALPSTEEEINSYFEWHVNDADYVLNKLMPSHLKSYFREKHDITLLWYDTRTLTQNDCSSTLDDEIGANIMKTFLASVGGCMIPVSRLCYNFEIEEVKEPLTCDWNSTCLSSLIPMTTWLQRDSKFPTESKPADEIHTIHVCRKLFASGSFQIQKICTLTTRGFEIDKEVISAMLSGVDCSSCVSNSNSKNSACTVSYSSNCEESRSKLCVRFNENFLQKCENSVKEKPPETVFMVTGTLRQNHLSHLLKSHFISGLYFTWCGVSTDNTCLSSSDILIVRTHKYCTKCGSEPSTDHCGAARYALLQIMTSKLGFIVFLSSTSSNAIMKLLNSEVPGWIDLPMTPQQDHQVNNPVCVELSDKPPSTMVPLKPKSFHPSMLERWSNTSVTGTLDDLILDDVTTKSNEIHDDILQKLQDLYMSKPDPSIESEEKKVDNIKSNSPQIKNSEFESEEKMIEMLKIEYNKALESEIKISIGDVPTHYCGEVVHIAQSIASVVFHHAQNTEESDWKKFGESLVTKHFICSASDIRRKNMDATSGKLQESILQILLRLECVSRLQPLQDDAFEELVEDICSLLRLISLSISPEMMLRCLSHVFVENYTSTCGELLCEVHSELMQPIPLQLKSFSKEASEESADMTGIKSVLSSVMSNNSSACSFGPGSNSSMTRKPMRRISSFTQLGRQIEVPGLIKQKSSASLNDERTGTENIKSRLRSSAKKEKNTNLTSMKKVGLVKRDLFSVGDGGNKSSSGNVSNFESSNQRKPNRRMSVSDTPDSKQRMTALSRQRLRLHKEQRNKDDKEMMTIIEESPMKLEDEPVQQRTAIKSPRHKVMLARRHSFYCDGRESRNVARAKIIHQHQQVAPSTPSVDGKKKKRAELSDGISPNSLLFVHNSQKNFASPVRTKPLLSLCDDSPAKNTRSHATKALFQSPVKEKGTTALFRSPMKQSGGLTNWPQSTTPKKIMKAKTPVKITSDVYIKGIKPIMESPLKIEQHLGCDVSHPSFVSSSMLSPVKTPLKRKSMTPKAKNPRKIETVDNNILKMNLGSDTDDACKYPDLLAVADAGTDEKLSKSQTTLDCYVIRTPREKRVCSASTEKSQESKKRKWSVDTTPTRDDINKWPRKKRGTDKSSPGIVSKKVKRSEDELLKNRDAPAKLFEDCLQDTEPESFHNDVFSSPDNGLIVMESCQSTSAGTSKSYSAVKAPPLLHEMRLRNTDTNENIVGSHDFLTLPPTPKLRLGISRHPTNKTITFSKSKKQSADEIWNEVFPLDEQDENLPEMKPHTNIVGETSKLSARSLLHIQNSPILTPNQKKAARAKMDFVT